MCARHKTEKLKLSVLKLLQFASKVIVFLFIHLFFVSFNLQPGHSLEKKTSRKKLDLDKINDFLDSLSIYNNQIQSSNLNAVLCLDLIWLI